MSKLDRLLGKIPPEIPAGGRAYVKLHDGQWSVWVDAGSTSKKVSPTFSQQVAAYQYLDWVEGLAESFNYPEGSA